MGWGSRGMGYRRPGRRWRAGGAGGWCGPGAAAAVRGERGRAALGCRQAHPPTAQQRRRRTCTRTCSVHMCATASRTASAEPCIPNGQCTEEHTHIRGHACSCRGSAIPSAGAAQRQRARAGPAQPLFCMVLAVMQQQRLLHHPSVRLTCTSALMMTGSVRCSPSSPAATAAACCSATMRPSAARRCSSAFCARARLMAWARSSLSTTFGVEGRGDRVVGRLGCMSQGCGGQQPSGACRRGGRRQACRPDGAAAPHQQLVPRLRQALEARDLSGLPGKHLLHWPPAGASQRAHAAPLCAHHHGLPNLQRGRVGEARAAGLGVEGGAAQQGRRPKRGALA